MELSFVEIREKEIINIYDGKKLGHIIDIVFDALSGHVKGFIVPGIKKFMRRSEDIFIPISNIKKIGSDVIMVKLSPNEEITEKNSSLEELKPYLKYKRTVRKEK